MITWKELRITDTNGCEWEENLGQLVASDPERVSKATIENGEITSWYQMFLSAPGEEPDWDTPRVAVDWTGFEAALAEAMEREVD